MAIFNHLINILFPPHCFYCGERVFDVHQLCPECWHALDFIIDPICDHTGAPLPVYLSDERDYKSAEAILRPPKYDRARACVKFNDVSRNMIHQLKYKDQMSIAIFIANMMTPMVRKLINPKFDYCLCAVPLHYSRYFSRQFNQSELISHHIAQKLYLMEDHNLIRRSKPTRRQVGLKVDERQKNVKSAFQINPNQMRKLEGKVIILIDDVITSSATLNEITKQLRKFDVESVYVVSFAKTVQQNVI